MHIHIVLPEVKPNITVRYKLDLGLFRPATAFSIANCLGKLGCKLVEMSLAASLIPTSLISQDLLDAQEAKSNNLVVLHFLYVFEIEHVPRSTVFHMSYQRSNQTKPNVIVRHAFDLGLLRSATAFSVANC